MYLIDSRLISVDCDTSATCRFCTLEFTFYTNSLYVQDTDLQARSTFQQKIQALSEAKDANEDALQVVFMVTPQEIRLMNKFMEIAPQIE